MKLKRLPEDFRVEELPAVTAGQGGRFVLYRLTKRNLGTLEAIDAVCRRWNIAGRRVSYGGLKDRHALTIQYLTIVDGPETPLHQANLDLVPLGRISQPYGPAHFRGNRFIVVLRDLTRGALDRAKTAIGQLPRDGLPNYFDDQRFGSVGFGGGFIAQAWLAGDFERALRLALAEPNPSDRPGTKAEKAILREEWGRWAEAKARLERSSARSIVTYLVDHPADFRGAFARIRRELRSLYFSAFQSHVWNLILGRWIEENTREDQRLPIDFKVATLPIQHRLSPEQSTLLAASRVPLPSSRTRVADGPLGQTALGVVAELGLAWEDFRVRHLKDVFFSKGDRPALFFPENLEHAEADDELAPGKKKLSLSFDLPKGAYATLVVKRVTEVSGH